MSLINDALKKAQKQRADDVAGPAPVVRPSPAPAPAPAAVPPAPLVPATPRTQPPISAAPRPLSPATAATRTPSPARSQDPTLIARAATTSPIRYQAHSPKEPVSPKTLWLCLSGIALVLGSVGITLSLTKTKPNQPVVTPKTAAVSTTARPIAAARESSSEIEIPKPTPTLSVPTLAVPASAPADAGPAPSPTVAFASAPAEPVKPLATPPAPAVTTSTPATPVAAATVSLPPIYTPRAPAPVNPSLRIQSFIDRLRVTGIRMSATGSKVILGDRMFNLGDVVDSGLELRLVKVETGVLTFADASGRTYIKLFQ